MDRPPITTLRLVTRGPLALHLLASEFPTVTISRTTRADHDDVVIDAEEWSASETFRPFDDALARPPFGDGLAVVGDEPARAACESLTRYQRCIDRRNAASMTPAFDAVLEAHRLLHDLAKPLVRADYHHALDTWQWMLRLCSGASVTAQLAALFHDVERLESEADRRIEHRAPDYQAFKDAHAWRGGEHAESVLTNAGIEPHVAARVREIIAMHERRRDDDEDVALLNDADALSFFSLNSAGYLDYFGVDQTRRKIAYTLGRLGRVSRAKLRLARLRPDVDALLREAVSR